MARALEIFGLMLIGTVCVREFQRRTSHNPFECRVRQRPPDDACKESKRITQEGHKVGSITLTPNADAANVEKHRIAILHRRHCRYEDQARAAMKLRAST